MKKITLPEIFSMHLFFIAAIILSGCNKDKTEKDILTIGDSFQGGIIFYLDDSGEHGLIAATSDQAATDPWWNGSFILTNAISTTDGNSNTTAIINAQGNTGNYAAVICRNYRGGGYSDWFLPSRDQLNMLYNKKTVVGGFSNQIYWSSTEYELGSAWVQNFSTGEQHLDNISDGANVHTRAIRAF